MKILACATKCSKYPPAKPGALGCEPLKAAEGAAEAAPDRVGHLKVAHQRHRFICSRRLSSSSCFLMYSRITSVSRPTVDTKYPLAQKCWPTKFRFFSPYTRAKCIALFPLINPITLRSREAWSEPPANRRPQFRDESSWQSSFFAGD